MLPWQLTEINWSNKITKTEIKLKLYRNIKNKLLYT